jgi:hypothetical protein
MELSLWRSQWELARRTEVPGETTAVSSAEQRRACGFTKMCQMAKLWDNRAAAAEQAEKNKNNRR